MGIDYDVEPERIVRTTLGLPGVPLTPLYKVSRASTSEALYVGAAFRKNKQLLSACFIAKSRPDVTQPPKGFW